MINEKIILKDYFPMLESNAYITSYCNNGFVNYLNHGCARNRKTILLFPAGGYRFVSRRENEPIALKLLANGINVFVLEYSVAPLKHPYPLVEAYAALAYIRMNSDKYSVDPSSIGVMGFSAGGHLAATCACYQESEEYANFLGVDKALLKVNGLVSGYGVVTLNPGEPETNENITRGDEKLRDYYMIHEHITKDFPPSFIWSTAEDKVVNPVNSLKLIEKLLENDVRCELHIYPEGLHGVSLSNEVIFDPEFDQELLNHIQYNEKWFDEALHFIKEYF